MPKLDERLKAVARQIRTDRHADVGSDHGHLLKALLASGRIRYGIAIENKRQPFANSQATLRGLAADVRLGDGVQPLRAGEVDSLSLCGMGGESMTAILSRFPDRLPAKIVMQPNRRAEQVRLWGLRGGFHLVDEQIAVGHRNYVVLTYQRVNDTSPDPAYDQVDRDAAVSFGPWILKRQSPALTSRMREEQRYLRGLGGLCAESRRRLTVINDWLGSDNGQRT
ncbi:MAG: class I SAM-dependent methyltransferase [Planctomycetota bacterium]